MGGRNRGRSGHGVRAVRGLRGDVRKRRARWLLDGISFRVARNRYDRLRMPAGLAQAVSGVAAGSHENVGLGARVVGVGELSADPDALRFSMGPWARGRHYGAVRDYPG